MANLSIFAVNLLLPVALLVFASGFFPYKAFLPGHASSTASQAEFAQHAPFDKLIFMVVDALRSDFVYSHDSGFRFTQELIRSGSAMPFTAHATAPTITMPRIKAITTGSVPSFLDVILNFAESDKSSSLENQDTWLAQLRAKRNGRLVLYGDDTWLKLFPNTFSRADGTSSFFVSDFTEVDHNVTRALPAELINDDWNGMILHYLGLDHIGHKSGPNSPHMIPKQAEMDIVVRTIYHAIENQEHLKSTLLVICGDHGMNEAGNHGGSSEGETSPALVFISPKLRSISDGLECPIAIPDGTFEYYRKVEQSDIAPTLAGLLGFPIPKNNIGIIIQGLLPFWNEDDRNRMVEQNAEQFLGLLQETFLGVPFDGSIPSEACTDTSNDGARLACLWSRSRTPNHNSLSYVKTTRSAALRTFLREAQRLMSNAASNYSINKLYSGITIASSAALWISGISATALRKQKLIGLWFSLVTLAYGVMSSASSYVEEEQQYWYFVASTWFWWLAVKRYARGAKPKAGSRSGRSFNDPWSLVSAATPLLAVRVIRAWNQTGQKHAGEPDIARGFLPFHNHILWSLVCLVYVVVAGKMLPKDRPGVGRLASVLFAMLICTTALAFKIAFTMADEPELLKGLPVVHNGTLASLDLTTQARAVFSGILIFCLGIYFSSEGESSKTRSDGDMATQEQELVRNRAVPTQLESLHGVLTLFLVTQSRVSNIPLFALFELQMRAFASMDLSPAEISLTSIILQYASFFAFGGSNAISSIDLSNGYNGVSGYNAAMVGILTFCSNWAGPIWWTSATMILLGRFQGGWNSPLREFGQLTTCFAASSVLFMMLACTALRTHLFIWSVFSPKYLYVLAWNLGQHLCINMSSISLFVSLNSR